jgi:asparagine synthase (glutamine-hydrolysing)
MCGIIAITGKKTGQLTDEKVFSMLSTLSRRGPDDRGFERFTDTVIGQTRLSIVDIEHGHQPMRDNTHPYSIVFNGEIYGYRDLKQDLEKKGHIFSTQSDTEVILKTYAEYGEECLKHIDGMFAFALWDNEKKRLFIARDRFGKKPLYYAEIDGTFYIASEIKALFATGLILGEIDPSALDEYLRFGYIPPYRTVYKNIHTILPAQAGVIENGVLRTWQYWKLEKKERTVNHDEAKAEIKRLFDEAVRKRMIADVEIGSLLSGGVDSTIVTLYAQKHSSFPIKTFSIGYAGATNELPHALEASKKIGTDHYPLSVSTDLVHELEEIVSYMDEPHGDSSDFPQHLISKLASTKVKVALSGDGADELFMGYGWYQKQWHIPRWKPSRWLGNPFSTYMKAINVFDDASRKKLLKTGTNKSEFEDRITKSISNPIEKINAFDLGFYLPGQLLSKIDRTSMMHSLEIRSPFLDTALAEYIYSLPTEFKLSKTENKILLKEILAEVFPREFVYRRKQGFGAPVLEWLREEKIRVLVQRLLKEENPAFAYLDRTTTQKVFDSVSDRQSAQCAWVLLSLLLWFEKHQTVSS